MVYVIEGIIVLSVTKSAKNIFETFTKFFVHNTVNNRIHAAIWVANHQRPDMEGIVNYMRTKYTYQNTNAKWQPAHYKQYNDDGKSKS